MKLTLLLISLFWSSILFAHQGHEAALEAAPSIPGTSLFHLKSEWKNQKGESTKLANLGREPRLLVMLFTRCETACPLIVEDLKEIAKDVDGKRSEKIAVSLFSLDSFRETPDSLSAFAQKRKLPAHWSLFASNADAVAELAAALGVRYKRLANGDFIHSNIIFFLNRDGEVVARKEGIKSPRKEFLGEISKRLSPPTQP